MLEPKLDANPEINNKTSPFELVFMIINYTNVLSFQCKMCFKGVWVSGRGFIKFNSKPVILSRHVLSLTF